MKVTFEARNFTELKIQLEGALNELHTPASNHVVATPAQPAAPEAPINPVTVPPAGQQFMTSSPSPAHTAPIVSDYVQGSGLGVDAEGLPWDERIHSSNKKRTAKNIWVERRNVTDETYNAVVAELRGAPAAPSVPTPPPAPVPQNPADVFASIPAQFQPPAGASPTPVPQAPTPAPVPPPAPVAPVVPTPPDAPTSARSIGDLITRIQGLFASSTADAQYVTNLQARVGAQFGITVASITDIQARPDAIQYALDLIAADGK